MNKTGKIIEMIILTQIASDAGKNIFDDKIVLAGAAREYAEETGYGSKAYYERSAIELINKVPGCGINYWVSEDLIVYFDIRLNGKRYQISFHNPNTSIILGKYVGKGRKTRWTCDIDGSRKAARELSVLIRA